ncbi:MAG: hypothetical protein IJA27_03685 [Lachnospiraceae bacterium]|nr:hypothetical protein [Lachnospiraceae bacterium]
MGKWKQKSEKFFQGRYGMDELGKAMLIANAIIYLIGCIFQSGFFLSLGIVGVTISLYRMLSRRQWDRNEENKKYMRYKKLWQLRYEQRNDSRIYMCKSCGRYIRVPKGKGKIMVTCTVCGDKRVHRT